MNDAARQLNVITLGRQPYQPVWDFQRYLQRKRIEQEIGDTLIFVEHDPVYTIGKNGTELHVIASGRFLQQHGIEVVEVDRGGDVTYHGPGQLVGYPIFDLRNHRKSISWYMRQLEAVFLEALQHWGITASRDEGNTGVWVGENKVVAMGVRIARWVTMHGFAMNIATDLSHYDGIIPCGIFHKGVTSLEAILKRPVEMAGAQAVVQKAFLNIFEFDSARPARELWDDWEPAVHAGH